LIKLNTINAKELNNEAGLRASPQGRARKEMKHSEDDSIKRMD